MILADTSAWVEFDRATGSEADNRLTGLIRTAGPLAVSEPVLMEVLAGARSERRAEELRRLLTSCHVLPFDPTSDFESAAGIYRTCRRAGVTPRGMIDCMIAAVAWRHRAALLAQDVDLVRIAGVIGIDVDPASRT